MLLGKDTIKDICLHEIKNAWQAAPDTFPDFLTEISIETKTQNEKYIQTVSRDLQKLLKSFPVNTKSRGKWKHKITGILNHILSEETIIGVHYAMNQETLYAFQDELTDFLVHARRFAPELSIEEIGQAIRNYVVYMIFNEMNQLRPGFSIAGFGYSMLYPFTDNYIDNPLCSDMDKVQYNQLIRDKIAGSEVHPETIYQQKTCDLLSAIESEYPRDSDATIFTMLLMMLDAQEDSLRQQSKGTSLSLSERLDISLYKGGISVLIDRFFVKKEITEDDLIFYLEFGFFLQLADDLQDIREDSRAGHQTSLTLDVSSVCEEKTVNKMLHFVHQILHDFHAENDVFKNFVLNNCYQLIYSSAVGSREFFSLEYLEKLEKYLPVTYPFLEKMNRKQNDNKDFKIQDKYMNMMDEMIGLH